MNRRASIFCLSAFITAVGLSLINPVPCRAQAPPKYCSPCLFYSGDFGGRSDPDANFFYNMDTITYPVANVLVPFPVPDGETWEVTGLFTNNAFSIAGAYPDPLEAEWFIYKDVIANCCATVVGSGIAAAQVLPTGRYGLKEREYTVAVLIPRTVLTHGAYWLEVIPICTNQNDPNCSVVKYSITNTEGANAFGPPEVQYQGYWNSCTGTCDPDYIFAPLIGFIGDQALSAGVMGKSY